MPIYKVTYSREHRRVALYNFGCNFRCKGCSYNLLMSERPMVYPSIDQIKGTLQYLKDKHDFEVATFLGGEPSINPQLPELLRFCKCELGVKTYLGHTNGSNLLLDHLDGANVTFKAFSEERHLEYTGYPKQPIYANFARAFERGMQLHCGAVLIPNYIGIDELEGIVKFVANLSPEIPFHIIGYIPTPNSPWRMPTEAEMMEAVAMARSYLTTVTFSRLTPEEALRLRESDPRYRSVRVL